MKNQQDEEVAFFDSAGNQLRTANLSSIEWDWQGQIGSTSYPDPDDASATVSEYYRYAPGGGQRVRKVRETVSAQGLVTKLAIADYLGELEKRADYVQADPAISIEFDGETISNAVAQKDYSELRIRLGHAQSARLLSGKLSAEGPEDESRSYFDLSNQTDSVQMELDEAGAISSHQSYYPFGGTVASADRTVQTGLALKHYQYSGQEKDNSGLYYYGYRYYDPSAFRWTRPDPAGAAGSGFNWYAMVSNNPVTHRDVLGLVTEQVIVAGIFVGFIIFNIILYYGYDYYRLRNRRYIVYNAKNKNKNSIWIPVKKYEEHNIDIFFIGEYHKHQKYTFDLLDELKYNKIIHDVYLEGTFVSKVEFEKSIDLFYDWTIKARNSGCCRRPVIYKPLEEYSLPSYVTINKKYMTGGENKREEYNYDSIFEIIHSYTGNMDPEYRNALGQAWDTLNDDQKKEMHRSRRYILWKIEDIYREYIRKLNKRVAIRIGCAHFWESPDMIVTLAKKNFFAGAIEDFALDYHVRKIFPAARLEFLISERSLAAALKHYEKYDFIKRRPVSISGPYSLSGEDRNVFYRLTMLDIPEQVEDSASQSIQVVVPGSERKFNRGMPMVLGGRRKPVRRKGK